MSKIYMSISPELQAFLQKVRPGVEPGDRIEIDELYALMAGQEVDINVLLANSTVVARERPLDAPMSELEMWRKRGAERKYQRSIQGVKPATLMASGDVKSASESISFATHFIFAFLSAFLVGYYLGEYVFDLSEPGKYICGGAASFFTLLLESTLLIIREQKPKGRPLVRSQKKPQVHSKEQGSTSVIADTIVASLVRSRRS